MKKTHELSEEGKELLYAILHEMAEEKYEKKINMKDIQSIAKSFLILGSQKFGYGDIYMVDSDEQHFRTKSR